MGSLFYHLKNGLQKSTGRIWTELMCLGMPSEVSCKGREPAVPSDGTEGLRDAGTSFSLCIGFLEKGSPSYCCLAPVSTNDGPQCCRRQPAPLLHPSLPGGLPGIWEFKLVLPVETTVGCRFGYQGCVSILPWGWGSSSQCTHLFRLPRGDGTCQRVCQCARSPAL